MPPMLKSILAMTPVNPKLSFSDPETIAPGVVVNPIHFELNQAKIPFKATYFQVLPGCETPLDCHQEEETWIVLQGMGLLTYEGTSYCMKVQDAFYFSSFKKHQVLNNSDEPLLICSIYW